MKAKLLTLFVIISLVSKSQITLENSYPTNNVYVQVVELVKYGYKYQLYNNTNQALNLYNLNHSLFKSISVQPTYTNVAIINVSDSLFNTDNLVEVAYFNYSTASGSITAEVKVINEQGTVLITIQGGYSSNIAYTGTNGYKMITGIITGTSGITQCNVYSLAGGLPVHNTTQGGGNTGNPTGVQSVNGYSNDVLSAPIPNPSSNKTSIAYQLLQGQTLSEIIFYDINGKEVKRYQVDNTFNTLELDNSDLPSGTYFYKMNGLESGKKMVIIK